jgi:hypothetical protein
MKLHHLLIVTCFLAACKSKPAKTSQDTSKAKTVKVLPASYKTNSNVSPASTDTAIAENDPDNYADYYIVIADTGRNYYSLRDKMFALNQATGTAIDTMDRFYNPKKDLIQLPDHYPDDDMFQGDYFPRRSPSQSLSLEYLDLYKDGAKAKTMALVSGIYENKTSADSALNALQSSQTAFVVKSHMFIGCIH